MLLRVGTALYCLALYVLLFATGVAEAAIAPTTIAQNFTTVAMAVAGAAGLGFVAGGVVVGAAGSVMGATKWAERGFGAIWWGGACLAVAIIAAIVRGALTALSGRA